jgi:tetratricopeptide (TPR) repeat protein
MLKLLYFSFICILFNCHAEQDYHLFNSIDEVIEYETGAIKRIVAETNEELAEYYISRGESYLISNQFEQALVDFQTAYELASDCNERVQPILVFRSLFGIAFASDESDSEEKLTEIASRLMQILDATTCNDLRGKREKRHFAEKLKKSTLDDRDPFIFGTGLQRRGMV